MPERTPIQFEPGTFRQGSEAEMAGRWYETHLIRWVGGVMRPIDGWEKVSLLNGDTPADPWPGFASTVRKTHVWVSHDGIKRWAFLCEQHLYVMTQSGEVFDITPTAGIVGPDNTLAGGYGDDIYYGSAGGLDPDDGPPNPDEWLDPPTNSIPNPAYPTTVGLPTIYEDPNGYGMQRPDRLEQALLIGPMWSLDNFGDTLLAMASTDRKLYEWDPMVPGTPAKPVVADTDRGIVPQGRCFVVTPERHVIVFEDDAGNKFNKFGWCSQELLHDWKYDDPDNSAGFYELEPAEPFITAVVTRYGVLAFTATRTYLITYYGEPYVYSYAFIGNYNAPVSGNAITALANRTVWQSSDGFWYFDGVNIQPLACTVLDWVQQLKDPVWQYRRCVAIPIGSQSEVWFFFPSKDNTENTHFAAYNFDEKWWSQGHGICRTAGVAGSALSYPTMSDGAHVFFHEKGLYYTDASVLPYAQSAAINVAKGARMCTLRQGIVDTRAPAGDVQFMVGARKARISNPTNIEDIRLSLAALRDRGRLDFRVTGRDAFIRIQSMRNGSEPWTFGQFLCKVFPRGQR
jgi:hypothetical protein